MLMPKRHQSETSYRYAYNGMEQDPEVKGDGNSYTTEFRQYDPHVGRWLSLDPLMHEFPWMSPYVAFNNNPIYFIDPLGLKGVDPKGGTEGNPDKIKSTELEKVVIKAKRPSFLKKLKTGLKSGLQKVGENLKQTGVTRLVGLVKTAGGVLEAAVGSAMISSGVGAPLGVIIVAHAADVTAAGVRQTVTGKDTKTLTSKGTSAGLQKVGVSQSTADFVGEAADMTVGMLTLSPSAISAVSTKIAAPVGKVVTSSTTKATTATNVGAKAAFVAEEVVEGAAKTGKSFFEGTKYTNKVLGQMKKGDFHGFPEGVKAFESSGVITTIKGGDGVTRQMLKIPGEYGGKKGFFEFIKEADGTINHRLFRPNP